MTGLLLALGVPPRAQDDAMAFWSTPRHGANSFNQRPPDDAYFQALRKFGASWVRIAYDKWKPEKKDFLIGSADGYTGLVQSDLQVLVAVIDRAHRAGLRVVVAPLTLPGSRWTQNNRGQFDDRLWTDKKWWTQSAAFWRDLSGALKGRAGIAALNLLNEPVPERNGGLREHASATESQQWARRIEGTARDLLAFYKTLVGAVRKSDPKVPLMLDAGWYGAADAFATWPAPLKDARTLYAFHMYEPYEFTGPSNLSRKPPYAYPGKIPFAGATPEWDAARIRQYVRQPFAWAVAHGIPKSRMVAGEFGCMRRAPGCARYLADVIDSLDGFHAHWAFYSFREDVWDGMDYELGSQPAPEAYWKAVETGNRNLPGRFMSPEFQAIQKRL